MDTVEPKKPHVPDHEQLKRELMDKFQPTSTYLGSFIKKEIQQANFRQPRPAQKPEYLKKGDMFVVQEGVKFRPACVFNVLNDGTVIYTTITSTENVHCLTPFKSRFFGEGCFSRTINVCTSEFALESFCGVFDNPKAVNRAIKELKEFINQSL